VGNQVARASLRVAVLAEWGLDRSRGEREAHAPSGILGEIGDFRYFIVFIVSQLRRRIVYYSDLVARREARAIITNNFFYYFFGEFER